MNILKTSLALILYTLLFAFTILMTPIYMISGVKTCLQPIKQMYYQWSVLIKLFIFDLKSFVKKYDNFSVKMPVMPKYSGIYKKAYGSKFKNNSYIEYDFSDLDFVEIFYFGYLFLYSSFVVYILGSAVYSAIVYTAIYVNPEVEVTKDVVKKRKPAFHKYEDDINIETYCPCIFEYEADENFLSNTKNIIIYDTDNDELRISKNVSLTNSDFERSSKEVLQGEYTYSINDRNVTIEYDDFTFDVNHNQGFVFINDLRSVFYFNKSNELRRVSRK